jgi:hypothetical protein
MVTLSRYRRPLHLIYQRATLACTIVIATILSTASSFAQAKKPNILVIFGDDIGTRQTQVTS